MRKGLLLGAGFSFDLGMPLVTEITDVFLSLFNVKNTRQLADRLARNEPYSKDRPINRPSINEGMNLLLKYKQNEGKNYEELMSRLEALGSQPQISQMDRDSFHYVFTFLHDLLYRIITAFQKVSYETLYELNRPWFSKLGNLLSENETWVFTLNHDLYLECLAIDFGIPISYGDTDVITFPLSNLEPTKHIRFSYCPRAELNKEGRGWFKGNRGINLVRIHGGLGEFQYQGQVLCNPSLQQKCSSDLLVEFERIESMAYYYKGHRTPSGIVDRVVTGPDGTLDILCNTMLTGGRKYSKTTNPKKGEEKLKLLDDVLKDLDELTIIGYSFGDLHINHRILNAMVLNQNLKLRIVDPVHHPWPDFLQQFDYGLRLRGATCTAAQWMAYLSNEEWDVAQTESLKENQSVRSEIRKRVESVFQN